MNDGYGGMIVLRIMVIQSIRIGCLEEGFVGSFVAGALVFAELGLGVGLSSDNQSFLTSSNVGIVSSPGLDGAVLKGSSEGEAEEPGSSDVINLIHAIEVE